MSILYEGKAKKLYPTDNPNELVMEFKDDATAFNNQKKGSFEEKGVLNKRMTALLYPLLEEKGIPTHFVRDHEETSVIVKRVEIVAVEVIVRNYAAGSMTRRVGIPEGTKLSQPLVEFSYKNDDYGDPLINRDYIRELKLASSEEVEKMYRKSLRINQILGEFFLKAGTTLADFKLEYGRLYPEKKNLVLADEISPDTCRFWDVTTGKKMDKDRFREDLGSVMEGYKEILSRTEDAISS